MISILVLAVLCVSVVSGQQTLSASSTGTNNGFYYSFWKDGGGAKMTLDAGGRYTASWSSDTHNWVGGKGWNPGSSSRTVNYSGKFGVNASVNSYLALYGWTRSPLIEYYVVESYGSYNPASCSGGTAEGSFTSGGANYTVTKCLRKDQPSIDGTATFNQYFSVRNPKKGFGSVSGSIHFGDHVKYWESKGLHLGTHNYQIMATEGYQSSGTTDITVS